MPTDQPSNAPDDLPTAPNDADTAATVLSDDALNTTPGGGGLGGASAADALGGSARAPLGTSPNAPMTGTTAGGSPEREAQTRSLSDTSEPHPSSQ